MLYLPEIIETTAISFFRMLYRVANFDVDGLQLAKIDGLLGESAAARTTTGILTQVSAAVSVVLALVLIVTVMKKRALKSGPVSAPESQPTNAVPAPEPGHLRGKWDALLRHLDSTHENDWRLAVMEADKLVDVALAQAGFPGESFGDRLTNIAPGMLLSLDGLWWAHKIRNRIAHEVDYFLRYTEAKAALSYYEAALSELRLI